MTTPRHVVLIGCGFTGTSAFFQLVDRFPVEEITIFEASGDFGPGYPYRTGECRDYLINNTSDTMCLVPSNRRSFVEWLRDRPALAPDLDERGHLPRSVFGAFLKDTFASTRNAAAAKGIKVTLVPREVTSIGEDAEGNVRIRCDAGEVVADLAVLTNGRCPDRDDYQHPPGNSPARYVATHVMSPDIDTLPNDAVVHVLGASLSAYDVVNRLFSADTGCRFIRSRAGRLGFEAGGNGRRVVLCSRSGRLKAMQSRHTTPLRRRRFTLEELRERAGPKGLSLQNVAGLLSEEAACQETEIDWDTVCDPYRQCASASDVNERAADLLMEAISAASNQDRHNFLVDVYADAQLDIWDAFAEGLLGADDEKVFRRELETAVLSYAAPCPVPTAEKLLALLRAGRLSILKGVREIELRENGDAYEIRHEFGSDIATTVINATGASERDVNSSSQPALIRSMVDAGLLSAYRRDGVSMNGAAVDMRTFRAEGSRNIYLANMLLWGPGFYTSSAFMMATVVERILNSVFDR